MLYPVSRTVYRWQTPDPADDWMMVGHLVMRESKVVLVDPPLVPGLPEAVNRLGQPVAVLLTTIDHARAARYFSAEHNLKIYVPKQIETTNLDPGKTLEHEEIQDFTAYDENTPLPGGLRAIRARVFAGNEKPRYDEMILLTQTGELLVGDLACGSKGGKFLVGPEMFNPSPGRIEVDACYQIMAALIGNSNAHTLLSSHWHDILGNLQEAVAQKGNELRGIS